MLLLMLLSDLKRSVMKRRPKYQSPDGIDWRDPDMPVLRYGKVAGVEGVHRISSNDITNYYKAKLEQHQEWIPSWREDETYDLASRHNRKRRDK